MDGTKHQLDLLLINPGNRMDIYQSLASELAAIEPPVWAGLMATFVRSNGYSVDILDANAEELIPEQVAERVDTLNPVLTAVVVYGQNPSASTQTMPAGGAICRAIKQRTPTRKLLMLGGHVAALPAQTLREEATDYVAAGEGLYTLLDLIEALKGGREEDLAKVRGLVYWYHDRVRMNPGAPLMKDVDTLMPEIAWDLLPMNRYRAHNWHCFQDLTRQPYAAVYTTLGCPYHCTFCCIQAPFKTGELELGMKESVNSYRFWSLDNVIAQIDKLVNVYGVRNIKFADEMFVLNPRHVRNICDRLIERNYDLNIWAYARVDTVRDDMPDKLRAAGFTWLAFGIETANERVQTNVDKRFDEHEIYATLEKCRRADINIGANYIFGLPEDDLESMQQTLDMALDINAEYTNLYCAMAYPGSQLYEQALREGWKLPETWGGYSQHAVDTLPLPTKYLSASEVLRFRDAAFNTYFGNPRYLDMITKKFGPSTTQHIKEMASHRLVRNHA